MPENRPEYNTEEQEKVVCDKVVTSLHSDLPARRAADNIYRRYELKGGPTMYLAEQTGEAASTFQTFDIFMLIFTILIAIGLVRLLMQRPRKNYFAIGFTIIALAIFLFADYVMISGW